MSAVIEVALDVRVTVKLEAEQATADELRRLVKRDPETVRGAVLASIATNQNWPEAGWLDEDRVAMVTEVIEVERLWRADENERYFDPKAAA